MKKKIYRNPVGVSRYIGLLLISPFLIGFLLFTLYPFISSFIIGLTDHDGIHQPEFIGLDNYRYMLKSEDMYISVRVTFMYMMILVPLKLLISLLTAVLLGTGIKGIGIYRTAFYIPSILGANLAVVIMWQFLFTSGGLVNQLISAAGLPEISWYGNSIPSMFMIVLLRLWEFGSAMILFLNAMKDIPREYYDAARVDGCGPLRSFFSITLPLIRNVVFLNIVLQTIAALQEFNAPYMITSGGPMKSTYTIGMLIYNEMFRYHDVGYANALSWLLFVIITLIVLLLFRVTSRSREENV